MIFSIKIDALNTGTVITHFITYCGNMEWLKSTFLNSSSTLLNANPYWKFYSGGTGYRSALFCLRNMKKGGNLFFNFSKPFEKYAQDIELILAQLMLCFVNGHLQKTLIWAQKEPNWLRTMTCRATHILDQTILANMK